MAIIKIPTTKVAANTIQSLYQHYENFVAIIDNKPYYISPGTIETIVKRSRAQLKVVPKIKRIWLEL